MHERSPKNKPIDTILYEIDMLRHCAKTLGSKKFRWEKTGSESDKAEYYLCIEGFLLHLRNLFAFFTNVGNEPNDLIINRSDQWAGRKIDPREYSHLIKRAREINKSHGVGESTCYDQISKFLQHCTTYRHERAKDWDIEKVFAELDPVLSEFEQRFAAKPHTQMLYARRASNSTETLRRPIRSE
jgi:hypothetical protein